MPIPALINLTLTMAEGRTDPHVAVFLSETSFTWWTVSWAALNLKARLRQTHVPHPPLKLRVKPRKTPDVHINDLNDAIWPERHKTGFTRPSTDNRGTEVWWKRLSDDNAAAIWTMSPYFSITFWSILSPELKIHLRLRRKEKEVQFV